MFALTVCVGSKPRIPCVAVSPRRVLFQRIGVIWECPPRLRPVHTSHHLRWVLHAVTFDYAVCDGLCVALLHDRRGRTMLLLLALFALALPVDAMPESSGAGSTNFSSVAVPMKVAMALLHLLPSSQPCCAAGVGRLDIVDVPASDEEQVRRQ
jgi:hypothetical protein